MRAGTVTTDLNADGRETYAYLVGARPNFMKMAPVIRAARRLRPDAKHVLIHTGQHYDHSMSDVFFTKLGLPEPDFYLGVGSGSHAEQTGAALVGVERALQAVRASVLVVPGDVNSTVAGALAASKVGVPVVHLEAGLRSRIDRCPKRSIVSSPTTFLSVSCIRMMPCGTSSAKGSTREPSGSWATR
jgi:UDP-N-acetylglucosamine 2-epimerase